MTKTCDTAFAHAVKRAASAIRAKPGIDVVHEAELLRDFLCSDQTLDPAGLELLALAVTGRLRKINQPLDETSFAHSVRRASAAWRNGKNGVKSAEAGKQLADMLRSGQPVLGAGEREELAELFSPQQPDAFNALSGRPPKGPGHWRTKLIARTVRKLKSKYGNIKGAHGNAVAAVVSNSKTEQLVKHANPVTGEKFTVSKRTVEEYEAITKAREAAIKAALGATKR